MKNITVLFAGFDLNYSKKILFENQSMKKSSIELSLNWALKNGEKTFIFSVPQNVSSLKEFILDSSKVEIIENETWNASKIALTISECCKKSETETALYAWIDNPFLNDELTQNLLKMHTENISEYSFADGFPYGVAPEIINVGTASILAQLSQDKNIGATRTALMDILKTDINAFEIETLISDVDYRPFRIKLESSSKGGFIACKNLFDLVQNSNLNIEEICEIASKNSKVLRTIPYFFDIQITSKINHKTLYSPENAGIGIENFSEMDVQEFQKLTKKIKAFNPDSVVSLSCFGEPTLHSKFTDFVESVLSENLRLLIETDGLLITEDLSKKIKAICEKYQNHKIDFIVDLDGADSIFYSKIRNASESDFTKAMNCIHILSQDFENHIYPQMTRMNANEENLEKFFRFWKNPENNSKGKLIIKKYDSLCKKLKDEKPADLSPLTRNPCWHLCRDFVILANGSVPKCRSCGNSNILGNAFTDDLEAIWEKGSSYFAEHIERKFNGNCGDCDEYYTFSF